MFDLVDKSPRLTGLYDVTLALFEIYIDGIRRDLFTNGHEDLKAAFAFLLTRDRLAKKRSAPSPRNFQRRVVIDTLSVIAIHMLVD